MQGGWSSAVSFLSVELCCTYHDSARVNSLLCIPPFPHLGSEWIGLSENNLIINTCTVLGPMSRRQGALTKWSLLVILECLGRKFIGPCGGWGPGKTPLPHGTELEHPLPCVSFYLLYPLPLPPH